VPPDVVCGWHEEANAGVVTFTPGQASIDGPAMGIIRIQKEIPNPVTLFGITGQYHFKEFDSQTADDLYDISIADLGSLNGLDLTLRGNGLVYFQVGPGAAAPFYDGLWTPNGGAHTVHYNVSPAGIPTIWIDGVLIPMVFGGSQPNAANAPDNSINLEFIRANSGAPALLTDYFLTLGILPPSTQFCCG
jgi:hypothetical protein